MYPIYRHFPLIALIKENPALRETNFLSRICYQSPEPLHPKRDTWQHIAVGKELNNGRGWFCLLFDEGGREEIASGDWNFKSMFTLAGCEDRVYGGLACTSS